VRVRAHWITLCALLAALAVALVVQGYTHHFGGIGDDSVVATGPSLRVPQAVATGGPVIVANNGAVRTAGPKDRTVALTFDDGPDPRWTPQVLAVLRKHNAHATFFVVGTQVIAHPELLRDVVAQGDEVGVHTLTHANLGTLPVWHQQLELRTTQEIIEGAAGVSTSLLRPPYSSVDDALTDADWASVQNAASDGYVTVLTTSDSDDWRRPGVARIMAVSQPTRPHGEVLLMHDGGGDRSQTVAALDRLLTRLDADGYTVTTVSDAVGLRGTMHPAPVVERAIGAALINAVRASDVVVLALTWALLLAGAVTVVRAVLVLGAARRHTRRVRAAARLLPTVVTEPATVIVPAYNESAGIEAAVRSIAASDHPIEIIVVDDGSTDGTADIVERLGLPGVRVIRQANGGKPAALNRGLRAASHDLIVMVDGDTVFEADTVRRLVQPFADPRVGAVSGNTKVANRGGLLGAWQHIEYVVGFNLDRRLFDVAECMPTVPGAIGGFRRSALERIGGVSSETLAEDTDLTMALCRDGWRVVYEEDALAWTEAPATLAELWKQRYRWCYGTLQAMWKHRGALVQKDAAGKLGRRGLVYLLVLQVLLPLFAPVVDIFAIYGLVFLDPVRVIGVWLAFLLVQLLMALYAFRLDGESPGVLWTLPLQQVVYRQLMYLVVIQSVFTSLAGTRLRWHRMERYGTLKAPTPAGSGPATR